MHLCALRVLSDGLLKEWNEAHPTLQVVAGDRILAVGGVTLGAEDRVLGSLGTP